MIANPPTDWAPWGGSISFNAGMNWQDSGLLPVASNEYDLYSVAVHELAHLLGIGIAPSWEAQRSGLYFSGASASKVYGALVPHADSGHFAASVRSTIDGVGSFEAALDPDIRSGVRKPMTDLDWAALRDVGWEVTAIPEPSVWVAMLGGWVLVCVWVGRRNANRPSTRSHASRRAAASVPILLHPRTQ